MKPDLVIIAGGEGQRLRPLTYIVPKPLLWVEPGVSIIEKVISSFRAVGIGKVFVIVKYKAELMRAFFSQLELSDVEIIEESDYMGTIGGLGLIGDRLSSFFWVTNCDILVDFNFQQAQQQHIDDQLDLSIISFEKKVSVPYGVFEFAEDGSICDFLEKPKICLWANSGVYLFSHSVLPYIKKGEPMNMDELFYTLLKSEGVKINVFPVEEECFTDIGEFDAYKKILEKI